jgi:hypothetical protein
METQIFYLLPITTLETLFRINFVVGIKFSCFLTHFFFFPFLKTGGQYVLHCSDNGSCIA